MILFYVYFEIMIETMLSSFHFPRTAVFTNVVSFQFRVQAPREMEIIRQIPRVLAEPLLEQ